MFMVISFPITGMIAIGFGISDNTCLRLPQITESILVQACQFPFIRKADIPKVL